MTAVNLTLFCDVPDEEAHGDEGGDGADPEGGGVGAAAHDGAVALVLGVGLHIDDVVLADVIDGGVIDALRTGEIHTVGDLLVAFLTQNKDILADTLDLQVACHGNGLEEGYLVLGDGLNTCSTDSTQDGEVHVVELHGDNGVLAEVLVHEAVLDGLSHLGTGEILHLDGTQNGEVDVAVLVHGIGILGAASGCHCTREVEELHELLVATMDIDAELVTGKEADASVHLGRYGYVWIDVLQVGDVLGGLAGGE